MDKFVIRLSQPPENPKSKASRLRWNRIVAEVEGRIPFSFRRKALQLLLDSFTENGVFEHHYRGSCPIFSDRLGNAVHTSHLVNARSMDTSTSYSREGISGLQFDNKGIYLASTTRSGCLTVHDFEALYCMVHGPNFNLLEDDRKELLHIYTGQTLDAVRWNPANQDEIACVSRQTDKVSLYDIGYILSEPVEVLEKGKPKFSTENCELYSGFSDLMFTSADKSRILASGLDGAIYIWDRRLSNYPCIELSTSSRSPLTCMELDIEDRIVFGASKQGIIHAWDLRGGRASFAFQTHNEVHYPHLMSVKISSMLEQIETLKAQSNIVSKEIHSISFDPSSSDQLAFHLDDGWSGVLNISRLSVTHVHCPPPPWLDGMDLSYSSVTRKPSWSSTNSFYAVGSSFSNGLYLLDFHLGTSSACHVFFNEENHDSSDASGPSVQNKFIPTSQKVQVCSVHPFYGTVIAGTKQSSLLMISTKHQTQYDSA